MDPADPEQAEVVEDDLANEWFSTDDPEVEVEDLQDDPLPGPEHEVQGRPIAVASEELLDLEGDRSGLDEVRTVLLRTFEGENKVRHRLAIAIVATLCGAVGGALALLVVVVAVRPAEEGVVRDVALPVITGFGPIAGAVVGFYFAETRRTR